MDTPSPAAHLPPWALLLGLLSSALLLRLLHRALPAAPARPPPRRAALLAGLVSLAALFALHLAVAFLLPEGGGPRTALWISLAVALASALAGLAAARRFGGLGGQALGLGRRGLALAPWGVAFLVAIAPGFIALSDLHQRLLEAFGLDARQALVRTLADRPDLLRDPFVLLAVVVGAPVVEEILFRGVLQTALAAASSASKAVPIQAALFALFHDPVVFVPVFAMALGLGWLYARTGSLWPGIVAHALFNGTQLALVAAASGGAHPP